jgi:hypothetical protein
MGGAICHHNKPRSRCPICNTNENLRSNIYSRFKKVIGRDDNALDVLGCSIIEYRNHIESKFKAGMTWENYGRGVGTWQIDHIISIRSKHDDEPPTLEILMNRLHYTNTQPLWSIDNNIKGNR